MSKRFKQSILYRALFLLEPGDRKKITLVIIIQIAFGFLDLLGVAAIGMIGALTVTGIGNGSPGDRVSAALNFLNLSNLPFRDQVIILGFAAAFLLVSKTIFSLFFTRKIMIFLSRRSASISANLFSKLSSSDLLIIQQRSLQETIFGVTSGVERLTLGVLAVIVTLISDTVLLVVMSVGLFVVDPAMAFSTAATFSLVALVLYKVMGSRASKLELQRATLEVLSNEAISEFFGSYREVFVRDRRSYYASTVSKFRFDLADKTAMANFMPNVSKYVLEITLVVGGFALCGYQFMVADASRAVAVLSIFLAASTRIGPAVLRIQQGALVVKGSLAGAQITFNLIESLRDVQKIKSKPSSFATEYPQFVPEVSLREVSFAYPGSPKQALEKINLDFNSGKVYAIVGPSGAGKTTLADILLGIFPPNSGQILISGLTPQEAVKKWPGAVGYVSQDVSIFGRTVRDVVCQGYPLNEIPEELIWQSLILAQLDSWVKEKDEGLDFVVGSNGTSLSGGQRQRLGIARALLTQPQLVVLDEATSSLDGKTEADIGDAIQALRGKTTVVLIAHRLATVRQVDQLIYLENGRVLSVGTFSEVRQQIPNFETQAQLMGL